MTEVPSIIRNIDGIDYWYTLDGRRLRPADREHRRQRDEIEILIRQRNDESEAWGIITRMRQRHVEGCPECQAWVWAWMILGRNGKDG